MDSVAAYIDRHISTKEYREKLQKAGVVGYQNTLGWVDYVIRPGLLFSYRCNRYTNATFRERLHTHGFYELVVYVGGGVRYLTDRRELLPQAGDVIITPPNAVHTAALRHTCDYTRYVLYFDAAVFGCDAEALLDFQADGQFLRLPCKEKELLDELAYIRDLCENGSPFSAPLAYSRVISLLCRLQGESVPPDSTAALPQKALNIKAYIDTHVAEIGSVAEVADKFFYSREHLSRYFSRVFNISVSSYLTARRIELAKLHLQNGESVTRACFDSGFSNVSFFIKTFRERTGMTPYRFSCMHRK